MPNPITSMMTAVFSLWCMIKTFQVRLLIYLFIYLCYSAHVRVKTAAETRLHGMVPVRVNARVGDMKTQPAGLLVANVKKSE